VPGGPHCSRAGGGFAALDPGVMGEECYLHILV